MSTLDVVAQAGARAANFLDVGGGASADQMATSLEVVLSDPAVKVVLVNIFGGITRCDLVAQGILEALERVEATGPDRRAPRRDERGGRPEDPRPRPRTRGSFRPRTCSRPRKRPPTSRERRP